MRVRIPCEKHGMYERHWVRVEAYHCNGGEWLPHQLVVERVSWALKQWDGGQRPDDDYVEAAARILDAVQED